jgi:hypothetical protein
MNGRIMPVKRIGLHPFFISLFPALTLLAHNIDQVKPSIALRSLAVSFVGGVVLFLLLRLLYRDWKRSAILATIVLVWLFSYGHIYDAVQNVQFAGIVVGRHGFLLPVWLLTLTLALWWAAKKLKDTAAATLALNVIAFAILILPLAQITLFEVRTQKAWQNRSSASAVTSAAANDIHIPEGSTPPDIYYIILDSYTRADILQAEFGYDNTAFLDDLTEMGFYVASCSLSNYSHTDLSLASSLNFDYLSALGDSFVSSNRSRTNLWPLIRHSAARQMLEELGYTTVSFETGYYWTGWYDADYFMAPPHRGTLNDLFTTGGLNSFEVMYLRSTAGLLLVDFAQKLGLPKKLVPDVDYPNRTRREQVQYILGQLQFDRVPSLQGPKLVFVHLVIPHPPNVFGPNGEMVILPDNDKMGYRDQVIFVSKQIKSIVKDIITKSDRPPVIVIQGDHGAVQLRGDGHVAILNAYYLPGVDPSSLLYPSISPVNTFRVIFNLYFGGNYPLLEDVSNFSNRDSPYTFQIMPNTRPGCEGK